MINSREKIGGFIKENFKDGELEHDSTVTREMEPRLKYFIVDRYFYEVVSHESLNKFIGFVNSLWDVEIFFVLGYLCIGYNDKDFGKGRNCVRLDAFVTPVPSAGAGIQDKVKVV